MERGLVSVIVPTRNRAKLLRESLSGAQLQSYDRLEVLVMDDASEDETEEAVRKLAAIDRRIRYRRMKTRMGACHARNLAFEQCRGEFVQFLDSDDLLHPEKFRVQIELLEANPDCGLAVCQTGLFRDRPGDRPWIWNRLEGGDPLMRFVCHDNVWVTVGPLWRRSALERVGPWDESLEMSQDYEHATRALLLGVRPLLHRHLLAYYRIHDGPTIGNTTLRIRDATHLKVFRGFWKLILESGRHEEFREDMLSNYLWVAHRAARSPNYPLAREALEEAISLVRDPELSRDLEEISDALRTLESTKRVDALFRSLDYGAATRERWWASSDEPVLPIPAGRRYGRARSPAPTASE